MSNPYYQDNQYATLPSGTIVKTFTGSDGAEAQGVVLTDTSGSSLVVNGANTGAPGVRVYGGPTDPISDIPVYVLMEHHQIHEGETHQYTYGPASLALNANVDLLFTVGNLTPTTRTPHFVVEADATAEAWLYIYETPTSTSAGTAGTTYNRNRNSATAPASSVQVNPTISVVGTLLSAWIVGSGRNGGGARESLEWDMAANKTYLIRLTGKAASNDVCVRLMWYEDLGV